MFTTGSIRKIEVTNFVTYSHVELYPGPNLNMLIGPNGTGKSTIVAAIILGLGGNPKVVGRGHKVSEYVKHNCDQATIHIHLQGENKNSFIKITRIFTVTDKTKWFLNNVQVSGKDVSEHIKQYNIQVDNLCQFLPQDRVQDFAKLNQQQLLNETQLALCRYDLIEKQKLLIEFQESYKNLKESIDKTSAKLQENADANLRLEGKIENFCKKKKFLEQVQDIERKEAWVKYDELYERLTEVKADLTKATKIFEKRRSEAKPIEKEIQQARSLVTELQQTGSKITRAMRENDTTSRSHFEKMDQAKDKIREINGEMNEKLAVVESKKRQIETEAARIEEMKVVQRELLNKCGNDDEIQQKVQKITSEIQKFRRHVSGLQNQKDELLTTKQNNSAQLRACENEKNRLENVKEQRLKYLQRLDAQAYEAVLWLRNNKHLFQDAIFEPIMLEINVLDPKNAVYVENIIPVRDRVAFTCTNKEDMNNLINYLRTEKGLTVNVVYAGDENTTQFNPRISIEALRQFGLYTYVHSLFKAPEPIMRYLCKTYNIHNIPVGNNTTNTYFQDLPRDISVFFSDTTRYSVSYSKYTNAKSTKQNEISSDGGLSISVDTVHLERLQGQIWELQNSCTNCESQIQGFDDQINLINDKIQKISDELKYIHGIKQQIQTTERRIAAMERSIQEMSNSSADVEKIHEEARVKIKRVVATIGKLLTDLKNNYKDLAPLVVKMTMNSVKIEKARRNVAYLVNKNAEARRLVEESETRMNQVKEAYADVKGQAKAILARAKNLSKNFTPEEDGFDEFRETYDKLSSDFAVLQEEKQRLEAMIECLNTADDEEMRQYEERSQTIANLQETIERAHVDLSKTTARIDILREEWLGPLNQLIAAISTNFSTAFERMGCAGEISLNPGDNEKDFASYGLSVKVTYRNGEPLQELNNVTQSGGERAVATAVYMLSLQELTPVPFRCVDEINQGMDSNNERRIFDLLVESTSHPTTAQYFLITPKLVPNLKYSRTTMVHIVHNGPFIEADRKWGMSRMCNPQRTLIH